MVKYSKDKKHFTADSGKIFVRIKDGFRMGVDIFLGVGDTIKNYREEEMNSDEIRAIKEIEEKLNKHIRKKNNGTI